MKHAVMAVMVLASVVAAEVSVGLNLSTFLTTEKDVSQQGQQEREQTRTTYRLELIPSVIICPGRLEIVPSGGFVVQTEHRRVELDGVEQSDGEATHVGGGGGCGFFLRAIEGSVLRLSIGPDVWVWVYNPDGDENTEFETLLGLPVNVDLLLTHRLFIRMSSRLFRAGYRFDNNGADDHVSTFTFFDIATMWTPTLGFYFTF